MPLALFSIAQWQMSPASVHFWREEEMRYNNDPRSV